MTPHRWADLDPRTRQVLLVAAGVEAGLKIAALIDLVPRRADEVRGPKAGWLTAIVVLNSAGLVPIAYLLRGRR